MSVCYSRHERELRSQIKFFTCEIGYLLDKLKFMIRTQSSEIEVNAGNYFLSIFSLSRAKFTNSLLLTRKLRHFTSLYKLLSSNLEKHFIQPFLASIVLLVIGMCYARQFLFLLLCTHITQFTTVNLNQLTRLERLSYSKLMSVKAWHFVDLDSWILLGILCFKLGSDSIQIDDNTSHF